MIVASLILWSVDNQTPIIAIALLVGSLLVIVGLLLLLLPHQEQHSRKSNLRSSSRTPVATVPGRRIRYEEAAAPPRFLSVPRINVLNPQQAAQPPAAPMSDFSDAPTLAGPSFPTGTVPDVSAYAPTVLSQPSQPKTTGTAPDTEQPDTEQAAPALETPPMLQDAEPPEEKEEKEEEEEEPTEIILPETEKARPESTQKEAFWREEDRRLESIYNDVMEGRITHLGEIRQIILEFEAIVADPERLRQSHWGVLAALFQLHQHLEHLELRPTPAAPAAQPLSGSIAGEETTTVSPVSTPETEERAAAAEDDGTTLEFSLQPAEHASARQETQEPAPLEPAGDTTLDDKTALTRKETEPAAPTFVRKARLSAFLAEPAIGEPSLIERPSQIDQNPPPVAPPAFVRRARLSGFPSVTHITADTLPPTLPEEAPAGESTLPAQPEQAGQPAPVLESPAAQPATASTGAEVPPPAPTAATVIEADPVAPPTVLQVICFGTVDILVGGKSLSPLDSRFRSSREFELMAFLAHWAATHRKSFVDRGTITEAIVGEALNDDLDGENVDEPEESAGSRRSPVGGWKYRLCRRLRQMEVPDQVWLETRSDGALRLRPTVQVDLIEFLQVASQLRKVRDQLRRPDHEPIAHETILAWLHQLQGFYRDRGEFAEQFLLSEWTQEPRRRYRSLYWHGLFYGAEALAAIGERPHAIQVAEELIEGDEVEAEPIFEALITWLSEERNKPDLLKWLNRYRAWYAEVHPGKSLDTARPDLITLLANVSK